MGWMLVLVLVVGCWLAAGRVLGRHRVGVSTRKNGGVFDRGWEGRGCWGFISRRFGGCVWRTKVEKQDGTLIEWLSEK